MRDQAKQLVLRAAKRLGLFRLARHLTGNGLRILCYHGISLADEHAFRGRLFMRADTFRARMEAIRDLGYAVLPLGEALERLKAGNLPPATISITFDDGWEGACRLAFPTMHALGIPATLYVTSYYVEKGTQIFNVAVQYLFWKTRMDEVDMPFESGRTVHFNLADPSQRESAQSAVQRHGRSLATAEERQQFLESVGEALGVEMRDLATAGVFKFATPETLRQLRSEGFELQLHTHRHNLHDGAAEILEREISDNRASLSHITDERLIHFCYPGGIYEPHMWPTLKRMGIESATTCEPGFNYPHTPRFGLKRILDEEGLSRIEFEAELSGMLEIWRKLSARSTTRNAPFVKQESRDRHAA